MYVLVYIYRKLLKYGLKQQFFQVFLQFFSLFHYLNKKENIFLRIFTFNLSDKISPVFTEAFKKGEEIGLLYITQKYFLCFNALSQGLNANHFMGCFSFSLFYIYSWQYFKIPMILPIFYK